MSTQGSSERTMGGSSFLMMAGVGAVAVIALLVSTVAFGISVFGTESDAVASDAGGGGTTTVGVMLMEFSVTPTVIEVPAGDSLVLNVTNGGDDGPRPQARTGDRHRDARPRRAETITSA